MHLFHPTKHIAYSFLFLCFLVVLFPFTYIYVGSVAVSYTLAGGIGAELDRFAIRSVVYSLFVHLVDWHCFCHFLFIVHIDVFHWE